MRRVICYWLPKDNDKKHCSLVDPQEPQKSLEKQGIANFPSFRAPASSFFWPFFFSSLLFSSLLFSSLLFSSLPLPSLPFPSLPFPCLPFPSVLVSSLHFSYLTTLFASLPFICPYCRKFDFQISIMYKLYMQCYCLHGQIHDIKWYCMVEMIRETYDLDLVWIMLPIFFSAADHRGLQSCERMAEEMCQLSCCDVSSDQDASDAGGYAPWQVAVVRFLLHLQGCIMWSVQLTVMTCMSGWRVCNFVQVGIPSFVAKNL